MNQHPNVDQESNKVPFPPAEKNEVEKKDRREQGKNAPQDQALDADHMRSKEAAGKERPSFIDSDREENSNANP